jgi:hypothetical protein
MIYKKGNLPFGQWIRCMKKQATLMIRMDGPFTVETREGTLTCSDGWLAIDSDGYPYPILNKVKEATYIELGGVE